MITHKFKTCKNKGHDRIWIEGSRLIQAGWNNGDRFNRELVDGVLELRRHPEGKHKIAGTPDRPIIDLCGQHVTSYMEGAAEYTAIMHRNTIKIVREVSNG